MAPGVRRSLFHANATHDTRAFLPDTSDPTALFEAFKNDMSEDFQQKYQTELRFSQQTKDGMVLLDILAIA